MSMPGRCSGNSALALVTRIVLVSALAAFVWMPPGMLTSSRDALAQGSFEIFITDSVSIGAGQFEGTLYRIDPTTGAQTVLAQGNILEDPSGPAIASDGAFYVADSDCCQADEGGVVQVNISSGAQAIISQGGNFGSLGDIAIASNGDIFVIDDDCCGGSDAAVIRVNPLTGAQTVITQAGNLVNVGGMVIGPNGDIFVASENATVTRVNPLTGVQTLVSSGGIFDDPLGIALEANGDILVADASCCSGGNGGIIRVNPVTGAQAIVAQGGNFSCLQDVAVAPDGDIFVVDAAGSCGAGGGAGGVIRVNPTSGAQTLLSAASNFNNLRGITIRALQKTANGQVQSSVSLSSTDGDARNDPNNDDKEDEARRRHRGRNNAARGEDDSRTEGNVVGVRCAASDPIPVVERGFVVDPDAVPYALIVNRDDGVQKVHLIQQAAKLCQHIRVGDYLEAEGEKQSEVLFTADEVDIEKR